MAADFSITGEVKLNSDPAEKATSKWTVAAGQLIADFAKKAASSLKSVVKSGLDYNAQMESYLTNFKVMLGDEQLAAAGIPAGLVRMSCGLEHKNDLIADIAQALDAVK